VPRSPAPKSASAAAASVAAAAKAEAIHHPVADLEIGDLSLDQRSQGARSATGSARVPRHCQHLPRPGRAVALVPVVVPADHLRPLGQGPDAEQGTRRATGRHAGSVPSLSACVMTAVAVGRAEWS
jgi:hypothetical protein